MVWQRAVSQRDRIKGRRIPKSRGDCDEAKNISVAYAGRGDDLPGR